MGVSTLPRGRYVGERANLYFPQRNDPPERSIYLRQDASESKVKHDHLHHRYHIDPNKKAEFEQYARN